MRLTNKIGVLLLAIWLILYGVFALVGELTRTVQIIMAILAIVAGAFLAIER